MKNSHLPSWAYEPRWVREKLRESGSSGHTSLAIRMYVRTVKHNTRARRTQTRFHSRMSWMAGETVGGRRRPVPGSLRDAAAASLAGFFAMNEFRRRALLAYILALLSSLPITLLFLFDYSLGRTLLSPHRRSSRSALPDDLHEITPLKSCLRLQKCIMGEFLLIASICKRLIYSLSKRIVEVMKYNGGSTKY